MSFPGATRFDYANGGGQIIYGCLNGNYMSLYISDYGHIGPQDFVAGIPVARASGVADSDTGFPPTSNIFINGQITPTTSPPTYGIQRYVDNKTLEALSAEGAIKGRRELLTVGGGSVCATWGVDGDFADFHPIGGVGLIAIDGTPGLFSVSGTNSDDTLSASNTVTLYDQLAVPMLEVAQVFSFQNDTSDLEQVRIKVDVTLTNVYGGTLTGVYYGFAIDPNPAITGGDTLNYFMTLTDPDNAFAVEGISGNWNVALGVYEGADEDFIVGYALETRENVLPRAFDTAIGFYPNIRLLTGTNADFYIGNVFQSTTTNFKTDTAWRASLSSDFGDYSIFIRSPKYDISGTPATFTYYIFTRPLAVATGGGARVWAYA